MVNNMMISPLDFKKQYENAELDKLLEVKNNILKYMSDYENSKLPYEYYTRDPNAQTIYFMNIEYLKMIMDLIKTRMIEEDFYEKSSSVYSKHCLTKILLEMDDDERSDLTDNIRK